MQRRAASPVQSAWRYLPAAALAVPVVKSEDLQFEDMRLGVCRIERAEGHGCPGAELAQRLYLDRCRQRRKSRTAAVPLDEGARRAVRAPSRRNHGFAAGGVRVQPSRDIVARVRAIPLPT